MFPCLKTFRFMWQVDIDVYSNDIITNVVKLLEILVKTFRFRIKKMVLHNYNQHISYMLRGRSKQNKAKNFVRQILSPGWQILFNHADKYGNKL